MSNEVTMEDLPDEMLEKILLQLRLEDRKSALRVCKRWSALKPFDFSSVQLIIDSDRFYEKDYQGYHRALLASSRRYKHVAVYIGVNFEYYDLLLQILSSFSGSVESLMLNFEPVYKSLTYGGSTTVELSFFAKIVALSSKLKHLHVDEGIFESDEGDLEFPPLNSVKELHLKNNLLPLIPNMQDITPNITKLHVLIRSEESLDFLRHVSSRLVELEIWFQHENDFLMVSTMQFPLLEKVTFSCIEGHFDAVHAKGTMDRFIQQLRGLKGLTLRSLLIDHVGNLLRSQSCENIQVLCLGISMDLPVDSHDFRAICKLKHLKRLRIENATISAPTVFNFPPLKNLHMLSLFEVRITDLFEFDRFRHYAFPGLAIFEMLELYDWDVRDPFELCDNICGDMPVMERLVIGQHGENLALEDFLDFCVSPGSRELRIRCSNMLGTFPLKEFCSIPVETLIMKVSKISLQTLRKLINSMGALKRFELAVDPFGSTIEPQEIRSLRDAFPRCEVILRPRVQIEEPL